MTLKFAAAQINTRSNDIPGNINKIKEVWDRAEEAGADMTVFPEQCICGYPLEDLAENPDTIAASKIGIDHLVNISKDHKTAILVGTVEQDEDGRIYNTAYIIDQGEISQGFRKQHLPNHDVFDEKRIYSEGPRTMPFKFRGHKVGIAICEDIWHPDVIEDLKDKGAEIILSPNGSPYYADKIHERMNDVIRKRIVEEENKIPLLYVNMVGGQDDIVFDGYSMAANANGEIAMLAKGFEEDLQIVEVKFPENAPAQFKSTAINPIYDPMEEKWQAQMLALRDYISKTGMSRKVLLGMSGGIDSAVVAALAADALGAENVSLYMLPSGYSSDHSITDSEVTAKFLGCDNIYELPIQPTVDAANQSVKPFYKNGYSPVADENIQARLRGVFLMAASNANNALLLSTGNKSEVSVGFCTIYGDMNGGYNPLKDVWKMEVYGMADWRNKNFPKGALGPNGMAIAQNIIDKAPSAELGQGQKDEDSLPPYPVLDDILRRHIEQKQARQDIIDETGYGAELVNDILQKVARAEFKRRQACPGPKLTKVAYGKGHRMPIAALDLVELERKISTFE